MNAVVWLHSFDDDDKRCSVTNWAMYCPGTMMMTMMDADQSVNQQAIQRKCYRHCPIWLNRQRLSNHLYFPRSSESDR